LFAQFTDVIHRVVAGGIKFVDIHGTLLLERQAAFAFAARFSALLGVEAVYCFGKYTGACGFAHAARAAKEVGMRQFPRGYGILQCSRQRTLTYNGVEIEGAIFKGRNHVFFHLSLTF
jgi:hypothetical protein